MNRRPDPRAVLVDDEPILRQHLKRQLAELWPDLVVCGEAENGEQALRLIDAERPDVVFLDIHMPGLNGLEVAGRIGSGCHVVFITAYDEFAVQAFEQEAADYLLKPVSETRLAKTIERLRERLRQPDGIGSAELLRRLSAAIAPAAARPLRWIRASKQDQIHIVAVDDVLYFESDEKYTSVVTLQQGELLIRKPVKELELELDSQRFWRIHRSLVVNVARIERTERDLRGRLWVRLRGLDRKLPVSRRFAHHFKQM